MKKDTSKLIDRNTLKSIIDEVISGVESELVKSSVKKSIENLSYALKAGRARRAIEGLQDTVTVPGDPSFNRLEAVAEGGPDAMAELVGAETSESVAAKRGEAAGKKREERLGGLGRRLGEAVDKVRANVEDKKPGFNTRYDEP